MPKIKISQLPAKAANLAATDLLEVSEVSGLTYVSKKITGSELVGNRVPYTGATANVDLGEYELKAGQLTLDVSPTGTAAVGTTRWNDSLGSSETTLKGGSVILKNGVDLVARIVNKVTPNATLTKAAYQVVRVSGAQGQRLAVAYAQANNDNNSADTLGLVIETIPTNQEGFIMTVGQIENINTTGSLQGETWADGDVLYLSPTIPGAITKVKPTGATGHIVVIGYVEYAHVNNGKIYVKIMNGWELDELHNVYINTGTLANNDALIYESSTQLWKNKPVTETIISLSDVTTNDVSTTKHGFVPKAPNDLAKYLRGDGTWAIIPSISLGRILFVATTGNDSTAIIGSLSNPYLTLEAAKSASTNGDLIYVFPGIYTVTTTAAEGLAKDGVRYYFSPEAIVNKSTTGPIFYANGFLYGFNVYGYGNFNKTTNTGPIFATNNILVYGSVTTFGSLVGGTGYTTGLKATTGGTGTGLIVNVTSVGGTGNITALTISNPGQTYKVGDVITITGGTTPATITVTAITPNYNSDADISFEANDLFMSAADFALSINTTARVNLKFNNLLSTSTSIYLGSSNITINMYSIVSTAAYAFSGSGGNPNFQSCNLLVSGYLIHATSTAVNIHTMLIGIGNNCTFNVNNILNNSSNGFAMLSNGYSNTISLNTNYVTSINGIYGFGVPSFDVYLNGTCGTITGGLNLFGGQVVQINNISTGVIDTTYSGTRANGSGLTISISGGNVTLNMRDQDSTTGFNISGGVVTLNGTWTNDDLSSDAVLTGGTLILNGDYEWGGPVYTTSRAYGINVTGGKLIVNGTIRINYPETTTARSLNASPIQYGSGKVIINGGVLISNVANATPIRATSAGLALRVYSGGMNTNLIGNGGTLAAKKMKVRFTVNAVASTSIILNDGIGGNETFTESNTAVYNTTALLAQRMVTLINASATLDITASQDTPGTDAYFYAEADVANAGYTVVSYANLTELGLVPGMFALTQSVLGTIIEDTDIE